jgi:NADH-ubiquinone oxidoreductase chain 3
MSSTIFFFLFIPILAFILLCVNLTFAPHNPYKEKGCAFECGFSSFLGQNRTQFSISFFIFALLFLLFDLEILLVYPYLVSAYTNGIYGLTVLLLFLLALTLGFAFELGKKALSIDSRQMSNASTKKCNYVSKIANNTHLLFNIKRCYSTNSDVEFGAVNNIISLINFIRCLVYMAKYLKYLMVSPFNVIRDTIYSIVRDIMCHVIYTNLTYLYFKNIYDTNGLFALLLALVDNISDTTTNYIRDNISKLLCFYFICIFSMMNIDFYFYSTVLSIITVIVLPFIIITLLKHTYMRYKESHILESTACGFLCLILIVLFIFLL